MNIAERFSTMHMLLRLLAVVALAVLGGAAGAQTTFRITSLYSNLDGTAQFVRLDETAGLDGQHHFAGLKLKSIHGGVVKEFTFLTDLPTEKTAYATVVVAAGARFLGGVAEHGGISFFSSDHYHTSIRFLPTDGGLVDFAGVDQVSYTSIPTDGILGLLRDGTRAVVTIPYGYWCGSSSPPQRCWNEGSLEETLVLAFEYQNESLDHYFFTASAPDIEALDSGRHAGWKRTGSYMYVGAGPLVRAVLLPPWDGCGTGPLPIRQSADATGVPFLSAAGARGLAFPVCVSGRVRFGSRRPPGLRAGKRGGFLRRGA